MVSRRHNLCLAEQCLLMNVACSTGSKFTKFMQKLSNLCKEAESQFWCLTADVPTSTRTFACMIPQN